PLVDAHAPEGECDAAGDRIGGERRAVEPLGPVGLRQRQARGAEAIAYRWIEGGVANGRIVAVERFRTCLAIDGQLRDERCERVRDHGLARLVAALEKRRRLGVEDLVRDATRLIEDDAAELGVGVELKVLALVEEPPAVTVDEDTVRIREPVGLVRQLAITVWRGRLLDPGPAAAPPPSPP